MVELLFSEKVTKFIENSNSGLKLQIKKKFEKLKNNELMGDYVFGVQDVDCREIKVKHLRFFTLQYRKREIVLDEDEFKDIIRVIDYARKNKTGEQQKIIDDIKKRVKNFGLDL